jgi:hypothetical protein
VEINRKSLCQCVETKKIVSGIYIGEEATIATLYSVTAISQSCVIS